MALPPLHDGTLQIFNVEHGGCALLTMPTPWGGVYRILIDCGHNATTKWYPGEHLRRLGVDRLQLLVVTNYDEDHASGLRNLVEQGVYIEQVLRNPAVTPVTIQHLKTKDGMGIGIETLVRLLTIQPSLDVVGGRIPVPAGVNLQWFWNPYPYFDDENNLSLVLLLEVHGFKFMFSGDMEKAGFKNMLNTNQAFRTAVSQVHVLMAAHHGRQNGICEDMFDTWGCRPALVVISDDYKQYSTQETSVFYGRKASGITGFRNDQGPRKVLTTRRDGELWFSFQNGYCIVG
jgi:beta-lactamase superfamily II metal-dependent hydrolase